MTKFQTKYKKFIENLVPKSVKESKEIDKDFMAFKAYEQYGAKPTNYQEKENE